MERSGGLVLEAKMPDFVMWFGASVGSSLCNPTLPRHPPPARRCAVLYNTSREKHISLIANVLYCIVHTFSEFHIQNHIQTHMRNRCELGYWMAFRAELERIRIEFEVNIQPRVNIKEGGFSFPLTHDWLWAETKAECRNVTV